MLENWKRGIVIPVAKPVKDPDQAKRYRPIARLSSVAKLIDCLRLPEFSLNENFQKYHHGLKKERSVTTVLICISFFLKADLTQAKLCQRTLLVVLDLILIFDTVGHYPLLNDITSSNLFDKTKRWILAYLRVRRIDVELRQTKSKRRKVPHKLVCYPRSYLICI